MRLQTGAGSPALSQSELTERCWADVSTCVPPAPQLTPAHINICCCSCKNSACNRCHHWAAHSTIWWLVWPDKHWLSLSLSLSRASCGCGSPSWHDNSAGRKEGRETQRRNWLNWCCHAPPAPGPQLVIFTLDWLTETNDRIMQWQERQQVPPGLSISCHVIPLLTTVSCPPPKGQLIINFLSVKTKFTMLILSSPASRCSQLWSNLHNLQPQHSPALIFWEIRLSSVI